MRPDRGAHAAARRGTIGRDRERARDQAVERLNAAEFDLILLRPEHARAATAWRPLRLFAERHVKCPILIVSGADHKILKAAQELGKRRGLGVAGTLHKPFGLEQVRTPSGTSPS